ncbi:MAG: hypothetical protein KF696_05535 [Planctomycetes bacterium]|nr:hypothetical protein [Planctomycetota bacterium]MCW8136348.1 hypothetical protein [Planctomycetota bacterium]
MAAPGVASLVAPPDRPTTYDNSWVNKPPNPLDDPNHEQHLSVDISERQLGEVWWIDEDGNRIKRVPGYEKRQAERRAARQAEMKKRMGITNIKDEQRERE